MQNIFESVSNYINPETIQTIQSQTGENQENISSAINVALPFLVNAMAKNSSDPNGASSLFNAVQQDHDGSVLEDIFNVIANPQRSEGPGILDHVFGNNMDRVGQTVSKSSGMNFQNVMKVLMILAPIVMGVLGKQQKKNNLDQNELKNYLDESVNTAPKERSMIEKFLDQNDDGSVTDDILKMGSGLFGKFLGR